MMRLWLRAHASRAPAGLGCFRRAFRRSHHGEDLCGRVLPPSTGEWGWIRKPADAI